MKNLKLLSAVILLIAISGCDYLGYNEATNYSKEQVFIDVNRTKDFLSNIYSHLPTGFNSVAGAMRASGADNAEEINTLAPVQKFNDGSWGPTNTVDAEWGAMYNGIRAANVFLKNFDLDNFKDRQYNDDYESVIEQFQYYPYQARFLRAFFYFKLIKRYGDQVPLITSVLEPEEANNVKPSSYEQVTQFIVSECDSIIPHLPVDYSNIPNQETGRATRGAAMALKARVLLYDASKLHNPDDNKTKWAKAAKAAKAIIDSSFYSLSNSYHDIFNSTNNVELIFGRRDANSNYFEVSNFPVGYEGASPGTAPTQNLVDAYNMQTTGKPIDVSGSGYDPDHPYENRDPRLTMDGETIIVNNSPWKSRNVEIWRGGLDGPPKQLATETGYYLKKYVVEDVSLDPNNTTTAQHVWVFFRYGGVLINYAEAMNEAYGPEDPAGMGMTARQAVNKIRERSNMPDFPHGMSQSEFRERVRNERRVEMAFENQRFWDIRRWKIGPSTTDIQGMSVTKNADGSFTYERKQVEQRVWEDKMYYYPVPQSELIKNDNLEQNPGWN